MALALLGKLSDPVQIRRHADGSEAHFWDHAWPHYLHGLTMSELAAFLWELNWGLRPVIAVGKPATVLRFCTRESAKGWPLIVGWRSRHPQRTHAALAIGVEGRRHARRDLPHALLLLDPAEAEPGLAGFNARLEFGEKGRLSFVTAASTFPVVIEGAMSIRLRRPP